MFVLLDSYIHRSLTPFCHGFKISMDEEHEIRADVIDPIGQDIDTPFVANGKTKFLIPVVGLIMVRKQPEVSPVVMPRDALAEIEKNAENISAIFASMLVEQGADAAVAGRIGLSVFSALSGNTSRVDHFGVEEWSPNLRKVFSVVKHGPWLQEPADVAPFVPTPKE